MSGAPWQRRCAPRAGLGFRVHVSRVQGSGARLGGDGALLERGHALAAVDRVGREAGLAVVVQPVRVGLVAVELGRALELVAPPALLARHRRLLLRHPALIVKRSARSLKSLNVSDSHLPCCAWRWQLPLGKPHHCMHARFLAAKACLRLCDMHYQMQGTEPAKKPGAGWGARTHIVRETGEQVTDKGVHRRAASSGGALRTEWRHRPA